MKGYPKDYQNEGKFNQACWVIIHDGILSKLNKFGIVVAKLYIFIHSVIHLYGIQ